MSDDKFSDPTGANNRWHGTNINKVQSSNQRGIFRWKRMPLSEIPDTKVGNNKKKQKLEIEKEANDAIIVLTDDESEADISEESSKQESPLKGTFSIDAPIIIDCDNEKLNNFEESPMKKNNIVNSVESLLKFTPVKVKPNYHDAPLPPGMPPMIAGVPVKFPVTPYKSQISVMNAVIKGCKNQEHCLLESPTGSGKTLALLCAALAWQSHYKETLLDASCMTKNHGNSNDCCKDTSMDFEELVKQIAQAKCGMGSNHPKIFYGSRTHKQIEQVIREFRKTAYADNPMTILSSREHSCIQQTEKGVSKTQLCNDLLDPANRDRFCEYYTEGNKELMSSNAKLRGLGLETPWDIEDLVELGKDCKACPYFAARSMMAEADIIFCPYNYLIDPIIRDIMQIDLRGHIVIIDEAHNIEGICRDVGSANFREDYLEEAIEDCRLVYNLSENTSYQNLDLYLTDLNKLIQQQQLPEASNKYEEVTSACWDGDQTWTLFKMHQLGDDRYFSFRNACKVAITEYKEVKEDIKAGLNRPNEEVKAEEDGNKKKKKRPAISFVTKKLIEELTMALDSIQNSTYSKDYRCTIAMGYYGDAKSKVTENTWTSGSGKRLRTLKFMCMNPAVIFRPVSKSTRCMILASGTLSPTSTFESELGTKFVHKLHANHVVPKEQVYVRGIGCGPKGTALKATYANVQTLPFKDDLGRLIVEVCQSVPHGVLCFFSSYSMMTSQIMRWQETGLWSDLESCKHILQEPRSNNDLEEIMNEYRGVIKDTEKKPSRGITGALLFAVFRGKVAEGIDFSDNEARCVLTIGIPYAVQSDPVIKLKREYNDLNRGKGLLPGGEWYSVQAYRALNQALGRCIRHRNDWGAVLLVDERLLSPYCASYLPKWIREMRHEGFKYNLKEELKIFVQRQQIRDKERAMN